MKPKPSEYFLGAILRGYDDEARNGKSVTCSGIWNRVVIECLHTSEGFKVMFQWDTGRANRNRVRTIAECIGAGLVPGLHLVKDAHGREFVERHEQGRWEGER